MSAQFTVKVSVLVLVIVIRVATKVRLNFSEPTFFSKKNSSSSLFFGLKIFFSLELSSQPVIGRKKENFKTKKSRRKKI